MFSNEVVMVLLVCLLVLTNTYVIFFTPLFYFKKVDNPNDQCIIELRNNIINDNMMLNKPFCARLHNITMDNTLNRVCSKKYDLSNAVSFHGGGPSKILRYISENMVAVGGYSQNVNGFQYTTCASKSLYCEVNNPCKIQTNSSFQQLTLIDALAHVSNMFYWFVHNPIRQADVNTYKTSKINTSKPFISMHIRRGDSCNDHGRKCYSLDLYISAVRKIKREHAVSDIFLVTDSDTVLHDITKYKGFNWHYNEYNRSSFAGNESFKIEVIENRKDRNNKAIMDTMFADLQVAAHGAYVIGTSRSFFTTAICTLIFSRLKQFPPIISLEGNVLQYILYYRFYTGIAAIKWKASWYDINSWVSSLS